MYIHEEGNSIPLPEIPTSIDPQQDPDDSSWGKDPASINCYICVDMYIYIYVDMYTVD